MQLYYFQDPHGNFGDDLNPWLWRRLLPDFFDDDPTTLFVGIGTLLNHRLPAAPVKHVFGSGFGYGDPPRIDERFVVHAVRGPHTARSLGIDPRLAITDAAVLLRAVDHPRASSVSHRFGFMPHCLSSRCFAWERVCDALGYRYIDARWNVEKVLRELTSCETVLCEAMHGAIAADTLRIPWIPVTCYDYISAFKWNDWLATLDLPYEPSTVTSLYDLERDLAFRPRLKNGVKRALRAAGAWSSAWTPPPPRTGDAEFALAIADLESASKTTPRLSADARLEAHVARYLELLGRIARR